MNSSNDSQGGKLLALMGPTAAGKTGLAVALVQRFPLEIISVDSALVYRGMDIGTAKPDAATLALAPHALIDIIDPAESYSAADFNRDATLLIKEIHERGNTPLLVGGSLLYFQALLDGFASLPGADQAVRLQIEQQAKKCGWQAMHNKLKTVDPDAAAKIQPTDRQRIQRALEVWQISGESVTTLRSREQRIKTAYSSLKLVICPAGRNTLHQRIAQRFEGMMQQGFLAEMNGLFRRPDLGPQLPSMRCVAYRQGWRHLAGHSNLREFASETIAATRQLAKRQLTWLRHEPATLWYDFTQSKVKCPIFNKVEQFLELSA